MKRPPTDVGNFLERRPITLDGFVLRHDSAEPIGKPSRSAVEQALLFAAHIQHASGYWIGDILAHCQSRADLSDQLDEIMAITGLARQTLYNKLYVARHVDIETRAYATSSEHAAQVASLEPSLQRQLLEQASTEGLTIRELRQEVKAATRPKVIEGQATLEGLYRVIYADPPWMYHNANPHPDGSHTKAAQRYEGLSIEALCNLPVAAHALPNSILFMWVTSPLLYQNPGPREVLEAWGFAYKSSRVWDKVIGNPGNYGMQVEHEILVIGVRGSCLPDAPTPHDHSVETIRQDGEHSSKPEEFRQFILRHWTTGPYLELFGRQRRPGWTVFGNDARLWATEERAVRR